MPLGVPRGWADREPTYKNVNRKKWRDMLNLYLTLLDMPSLALAELVIGLVLTMKYGRLFVRRDIPGSSKRIAAVLYTGCLFGLGSIVLLYT